MKILVINTGSSSIKYRLFDMDKEDVIASGIAERIGETSGLITHHVIAKKKADQKYLIKGAINDHGEGISRIVDLMVDPGHGVIRNASDIDAVGHRVVHGGETFSCPVVIDDKVIGEIRKNVSLAPLHNPHNLSGIMTARKVFPNSLHVAVFDTAFHQTLPMKAYLYALPYALYEKNHIRRYGFHGTSHGFVSEGAADFMGQPLKDLNLITLHLGNGASAAAVKKGRCVDTSMGLTPLEGLMMGSRSGDIDPSIPLFLSASLNLSMDEVLGLLNENSGLKGICGENDMRVILENAGNGDEKAQLAIDMYTLRIKKYIGAYSAVLGRLDGLVFTGGVGENAPVIRERCCRNLERLGIEIDQDKNCDPVGGARYISPPGADVRVLVVPANEELKIARETKIFLAG